MWLNQAIQVVTGRPVVGKARHRAGWWNLKQRSNEATAPFFGVIWSPMAQWPNGMSKKWRKLWPRLADLGAYFQTQMTTAVVVEPQNGQSAFLCIFGCKMSRQCLANLPLLSLFFLSFSTFLTFTTFTRPSRSLPAALPRNLSRSAHCLVLRREVADGFAPPGWQKWCPHM